MSCLDYICRFEGGPHVLLLFGIGMQVCTTRLPTSPEGHPIGVNAGSLRAKESGLDGLMVLWMVWGWLSC